MMRQGEQNFEELHFEPAPALSGDVPGARSREMLAEQDELESSARSYPRSVPVAIEEGRGATMRDVDGNTFIDFFGGAGVLNVGHSHPAVARAASEQQEKLVAAAQDSTRLARLRYQGGSTSYLEVLTTDSSLFTAQLNLVSAQQAEALTLVQLYSALGGGWQ